MNLSFSRNYFTWFEYQLQAWSSPTPKVLPCSSHSPCCPYTPFRCLQNLPTSIFSPFEEADDWPWAFKILQFGFLSYDAQTQLHLTIPSLNYIYGSVHSLIGNWKANSSVRVSPNTPAQVSLQDHGLLIRGFWVWPPVRFVCHKLKSLYSSDYAVDPLDSLCHHEHPLAGVTGFALCVPPLQKWILPLPSWIEASKVSRDHSWRHYDKQHLLEVHHYLSGLKYCCDKDK